MEVLINSDQIIWLLDFSFTRRLHVLLLSFFVIPGWVDVSWRRGKLLNSFLWTEFTTLFVSDRSIVLLRKPNITYLGNDKLWKLHVIPGLLVRGYLGTVASSCSSRRVTLKKKTSWWSATNKATSCKDSAEMWCPLYSGSLTLSGFHSIWRLVENKDAKKSKYN